MKDDTRLWLKYADENLKSAQVLKTALLFNPCLQNIQQAVEKYLKAVIVEFSLKLRKTHSINELNSIVKSHKISSSLTKEECHFLDSIYLPSKYPVGSALPHFEPGADLCNEYLDVAIRISDSVKNILSNKKQLPSKTD